MQFAVLLYAPAGLEAGPDSAEWRSTLPPHGAIAKRLSEAGIAHSGAALGDVRAATSLRVRDEQRLVTDGPFAETKEQLWGFYVLDAPDLDFVLDLFGDVWEARHGTVEVRPLIPDPGQYARGTAGAATA